MLVYIAGLREVERLTTAKRKIGTTALSTLITALSRQLVEADLQGSLNRHLQALNFQGLEVVVKSKTVRGKPMVSLRFKTVADVPLNSVLSQGEQRRLALAMFLAEMDVLGEGEPGRARRSRQLHRPGGPASYRSRTLRARSHSTGHRLHS